MNPYRFIDCKPREDEKHFRVGSITLPDGTRFHLYTDTRGDWYRHYSNGIRHPATEEEVAMWKALCVKDEILFDHKRKRSTHG